MTIDAFLKKYKTGVDYDGAYGKQCVDYVNAYARDVLGIRNAFYAQGIQYAYQVYTDYARLPTVSKYFTRVANAKSNFPHRGDVIVWAKERNGYAGHIAVVLDATEHTIRVAEQNYDGKGSVREYTYPNYTYVLGWLTPKNAKRNAPALQAGQVVCLKNTACIYTQYSAQSRPVKIKDFSIFHTTADAVFKAGAKIEVKAVHRKANGNIWVKTKYGGWVCVYDYKNDVSKV